MKFNEEGLLPPKDYKLPTLSELRVSMSRQGIAK